MNEVVLPSPPQVLAAVIRAASDPAVSKPELGKLVASDAAFAVRVLEIVNSSLYRRGTTIASVIRAVSVLGSRTLRNIALCAATQSCVDKRELPGFDLRRFWEDSLRRAVAAQVIAEEFTSLDPMEAFTAALLQDLGVLALVKTYPDRGAEWMESVDQFPERRRERERELFGLSHDQVGERLAEAWALPAELAAPLISHHAIDSAEEGMLERCRISADAELMAAVLGCRDGHAALEAARTHMARHREVAAERVDELVDVIASRVGDAAAALKIKVKAQPKLEEILAEASQGLVALNLSSEELIQRLEQALIERDQLARELSERNDELERISRTDPLTGVANRRCFTMEWQRMVKDGGPDQQMCLVIADIDHFKRINDNCGHDVGDEVLRACALLLDAVVPEGAIFARIGGEEFAVLAFVDGPSESRELARRLVKAVRASDVRTASGRRIKVTVSAGCSTYAHSTDGDPIKDEKLRSQVYRAADVALYRAKEGGRNRACSVRLGQEDAKSTAAPEAANDARSYDDVA